jgi:hypothetical protein
MRQIPLCNLKLFLEIKASFILDVEPSMTGLLLMGFFLLLPFGLVDIPTFVIDLRDDSCDFVWTFVSNVPLLSSESSRISSLFFFFDFFPYGEPDYLTDGV